MKQSTRWTRGTRWTVSFISTFLLAFAILLILSVPCHGQRRRPSAPPSSPVPEIPSRTGAAFEIVRHARFRYNITILGFEPAEVKIWRCRFATADRTVCSELDIVARIRIPEAPKPPALATVQYSIPRYKTDCTLACESRFRLSGDIEDDINEEIFQDSDLVIAEFTNGMFWLNTSGQAPANLDTLVLPYVSQIDRISQDSTPRAFVWRWNFQTPEQAGNVTAGRARLRKD